MKIRILPLFAAVLALTLAGCQSKEIAVTPEPTPTPSSSKVFYATFEDGGTKVGTSPEHVFDLPFAIYPGYSVPGHNYRIDWTQYQDGDKMKLVEEYDSTTYAPIVDSNPIPGNVAVYPYAYSYTDQGLVTCGRELKYDSESGTYSTEVDWPDEGDFMVAATASTEDDFFEFRNTRGLLHLSFTGDGIKLNKVTVKGNNNEVIHGTFRITFGPDIFPTQELVTPDFGTPSEVSLDAGIYLSPDTATDFYFTLPAIIFTNGITVTFHTDHGSVVKKTTKELKIRRSEIQPLSELEIVPTLTNSEIRYTTSDGLVASGVTGQGWNRKNEELTFTNEIDSETGEGVIRFSGVAIKANISFAGSNIVSVNSLTNPIILTTCKDMFKNCAHFNDFSSVQYSDYSDNYFDFSEATDFSGMFEGCSSFNGGITITTPNPKTAARMFKDCSAMISTPQLNLLEATDLSEMFAGCTSLEVVPLCDVSFNTSANLAGMFKGCSNLYYIIANEDWADCTIPSDMFEGVATNGALVEFHNGGGGACDFSRWLSTDEHYLGLYNWNLYKSVLLGGADRFAYNSVLWTTDITGYSFKLTGKNVVSVKTGVFSKAEYDAAADSCKSQVKDSGTEATADQVEAINAGGQTFALADLTPGEQYVLVIYYKGGTGEYGKYREETYTYEFTASDMPSGSFEDFDSDHHDNGQDYWN